MSKENISQVNKFMGYLHVSERYGEITHCLNVTSLTTRLLLDPSNKDSRRWTTVSRTFSNGLTQASVILPVSWKMSHNAAFVCIENTLHVLGGQFRKAYSHKGIYTSSFQNTWSKPRLVIATAEGCIERRKFISHCEFDGKLSAVYFQKKVWLYARANMKPHGGRHVQVTTSNKELQIWSPFKTLLISGVNISTDNNIYYFNVQVWKENELLALFPGILNGKGGVYMTRSTNGIEWNTPHFILQSDTIEQRTTDHPVSIFGGQLYVLRNVELMYNRKAPSPVLQRFNMTTNFTFRLPGETILVSTLKNPEKKNIQLEKLMQNDKSDTKDISVAMCLVGLPRMLDPKFSSLRHTFAQSLMVGARWSNLHVIMVTSGNKSYHSMLKNTYGLPSSNVHVILHNEHKEHCNTSWPNSWSKCPSNVPCTLGYYRQWEKADVCFQQIKRIEKQTQRTFDFTIKSRIDWPFLTGPPLVSLKDTSYIYARLRCASSVPFFLPSLYMSYNVHVKKNNLNTHNCRKGAIFVDDMFLISPRQHSESLFSADTLSCPYENNSIRKCVENVCVGLAWPECFLQCHLNTKQIQIAPIPITWQQLRWSDIKS